MLCEIIFPYLHRLTVKLICASIEMDNKMKKILFTVNFSIMFPILLHLNLLIQILTKYHLILRKTAKIPSMGPSFRFSIKGALP